MNVCALKTLVVCCSLLSGLAIAQDAQSPPQPEQSSPAAPQPAPPPPVPALVNVILHTTMGDIAVALEKDRAPITTKNLLHYVDTRRYDGATFYRAVDVGDDHGSALGAQLDSAK